MVALQVYGSLLVQAVSEKVQPAIGKWVGGRRGTTNHTVHLIYESIILAGDLERGREQNEKKREN
jgi:hypothetical protein